MPSAASASATSAGTLAGSTKSVAAPSSTSAYASATGLHATSPPLMLKSQQTSSSAETAVAVAPLRRYASRTRSSLLGAASPACSAGWTRSGAAGAGGRDAPQTASTGLPEPWRSTTFASWPSALSSLSAKAAAVHVASMPTAPWPPALRADAPSAVPNHSATPSAPGAPALTISQPGPSSFDAWSQYRPSVQHRARSFVTTAVPAEPVKPLTNARRSKHGATYSDRCGSSDGIIMASTPRRSSSSRSAVSVSDAAGADAADAPPRTTRARASERCAGARASPKTDRITRRDARRISALARLCERLALLSITTFGRRAGRSQRFDGQVRNSSWQIFERRRVRSDRPRHLTAAAASPRRRDRRTDARVLAPRRRDARDRIDRREIQHPQATRLRAALGDRRL
mmetsp:Transcript_13639/g.42166  ORF Transcript_13639/g.42166 Transcript_13639/m.42166 type:complete len:401 (-) Transcript_13639:783-1985(-)